MRRRPADTPRPAAPLAFIERRTEGTSMRRLTISSLALAVLAGPLVAAPLPPGVDPAELSRILGEDLTREGLELLWESADFHFRAARALAKGKMPAKASWHLGEVVRLDPENGDAHFALGKMLWRFGEHTRAKDHWVKAAEADRPAPKALAALEKYAPELAEPPVKITDLSVFQEVARITADFRRLGEVQEALLVYAKGAGAPLVLTEADWQGQLAKLVDFGLLRRPGGLPSGEGAILTDGRNLARSSVYGSPLEPRNVPEAMARPRGYRVAPKVLDQALSSGDPLSVELAIAMLEPAQLEKRWDRIASIEGLAKWPSALDQLCFRLEARPPDVLPQPVIGLLRGLVGRDGVEPGHRWTARGHLYRAGARDLPALPEKEMLPLLGQAFTRPTIMEAARSALTAQGAKADSALALLPSFGTRAAVMPLVELVAMGRSRGYPPSGELKVIAALKSITGVDHGRDLEAWKGEAEGAAD
jgi:hypothetical protein